MTYRVSGEIVQIILEAGCVEHFVRMNAAVW